MNESFDYDYEHEHRFAEHEEWISRPDGGPIRAISIARSMRIAVVDRKWYVPRSSHLVTGFANSIWLMPYDFLTSLPGPLHLPYGGALSASGGLRTPAEPVSPSVKTDASHQTSDPGEIRTRAPAPARARDLVRIPLSRWHCLDHRFAKGPKPTRSVEFWCPLFEAVSRSAPEQDSRPNSPA